MARVDQAGMTSERQGAAADPVRANEQAWRRAMESALFDTMKRDSEGSPLAAASRLPQQAPTSSIPTDQSLSSGHPNASISSPVSERSGGKPFAPSAPTAEHGNVMVATNSAAVQAAPSAILIGTSQALASPRIAAAAQVGLASIEPAANALEAPVCLPLDSQRLPSPHAFAARTDPPPGEELHEESVSQAPATGGNDADLVVPSDNHLFLEHTSEGLVIWMRDAAGNLATLAPTVKSILAEAARRDLRIAGLRLNGQAMAMPADDQPIHNEYQQGEDRGR